ncbi:c-type cytochrome [Deferribacteraceae bacterium V6Fe1]|nr:c-type cytochrome [Deferribacteraceae bacterium V6Fe1]
MKCHEPHYTREANCTICHRGIDITSRKDIAHFNLITAKYADFLINEKVLEKAREIVNDSGCRRCHVLEGRGNILARDLHGTGGKNTGEYIFKMIKEPNEYMPDFHFDNSTINKLVKLILFDGVKVVKKENASYPVFLDSDVENVFGKKCGNCHRAVLKNIGPAGKGDIGPNLSGLFSEYYKSKILTKNKKITEDIFRKWLKNPREISEKTVMPIIALDSKEIDDLVENLK